tara:strand:+ start:2627 stop:3838 length:1212 start_codon:yes stop_codon:yes gene_type:complete
MPGYNRIDLAAFVESVVPPAIIADNPELVEFIKVYALYLGQESFYINQLELQRDIDLIEESLLTELQNEIGTPIPRTFAADPRTFYKHLVDFYKSRGTPESIKAFFRLIYDDEAEIYFPKDDMFIPSDGKWKDQTDDIKTNPENYTPSHTWTIAAVTGDGTYINFADDDGFSPVFDGDVITVNGVHEPDVTFSISQVYSAPEWYNLHKITFTDRTLTIDDVIKSYRPGLFTVTDGFVSDTKKIQDSYFYQKFSYVLRTGKSISDWKNAFIRLIHPAGFNFFGEVFINLLSTSQWRVQPGYQESGVPFRITINWLTQFLTLSELGTFIEKTWSLDMSSNEIGLDDHFDNIKFLNWRPIGDYSQYTLQDVINNNIGTQTGCQIYTCTPLNSDTSYDSSACTLTIP